ncbi:MAG: hypothetical protein IH861_14145, partial [Chloroflexi bacterium]|nr:hypothetical protein [Chloroflexota bacterium]
MDFWDLYSRHIPSLKKSGSQWLGPCPYPGCMGKAEPKFYIDPSTGQYYCMRCGEKGNAITFAKYFNEDPGP